LPSLGIRSFTSPNLFAHPDTYGGDNWFATNGVHTNSSVQNHWFYLLATGGSGTNDLGNAYSINGVGVDTAFAIAYRNLLTYLTPTSDYEDAAFYAQLSASDLYGGCSDVLISTSNAWYAVGLGQPLADVVTADFAAPRIQCTLPATVMFSNNSSLSDSYHWEFGDGAVSAEVNPTHTYTQPGSYDVTLIATGCDGEIDTLTIADYIVVDLTATTCDTTIMVNNESIVLDDCGGVLLDSGGLNGNYQNSERSQVTINSPAGGNIDLIFSDFALEGGFDYLTIYDGPDEFSPQIGRFSQDELVDETISSPGSIVTLLFTSDGSVTRSGFVCRYEVSGGSLPAVAGFTTSSTSLLFNEPVTLDVIPEAVGRVVLYDFGDGTQSVGSPGVSHQYTESGVYTISQIMSTCIDQDTATTVVTVAEAGSVTVTPDSICLTLTEGDTSLQEIVIANGGPGDLYYNFELLEDFADVSSMLSYDNLTTTEHALSVDEGVSEMEIIVTVNGDFDADFEFATIVVEGETIGTISDEPDNIPNGTDITASFTVSREQALQWTEDGVVNVEVVNEFSVDVFGGNNTHRVEIRYRRNTISFSDDASGELSPGSSTTIPLTIRTAGLLGGLYTSYVTFETGDPERLLDSIPIKLTVIGRPVLVVEPATVDFGEVFIGFPQSRQLYLSNPGTDVVIFDEAALSDVSFLPPYRNRCRQL